LLLVVPTRDAAAGWCELDFRNRVRQDVVDDTFTTGGRASGTRAPNRSSRAISRRHSLRLRWSVRSCPRENALSFIVRSLSNTSLAVASGSIASHEYRRDDNRVCHIVH